MSQRSGPAPYLPYARPTVTEADVEAVAEVLRSDWLTTGPVVEAFEREIAATVGSAHAVAVSSGTAALHAAMFALGIGAGDEVIVPALTFVATANCVVYQGGTPVFADVEPDTLCLDPASAEDRLSGRTRAIVAVDYAGQPCDYRALAKLARSHGIPLVSDACHALGGSYDGRAVGSIADLSAFSFHPVKPITSGEGGMLTTDDPELADRARRFRNHGITTDHRQREQAGTWAYEMVDLGYNYRLTDVQCALGLSQLRHLREWTDRRGELAARYRRALAEIPGVEPLAERPEAVHAYHLFVVRLGAEARPRAEVYRAMREQGIGVNVHYIPVPLHPYYRRQGGSSRACPVAESAYEGLLSLPLFPTMTDQDVDRVVTVLAQVSAA